MLGERCAPNPAKRQGEYGNKRSGRRWSSCNVSKLFKTIPNRALFFKAGVVAVSLHVGYLHLFVNSRQSFFFFVHRPQSKVSTSNMPRLSKSCRDLALSSRSLQKFAERQHI